MQIATHPWVSLGLSEEIDIKDGILKESFQREGIELDTAEFIVAGNILNYRNKMEYGFWGDDQGLWFAHFRRGSHGKIKVQDSLLTNDYINDAGHALLDELTRHNIRATDLKSVILRSDHNGKVAAALFVRDENFTQLGLPKALQGLTVYYSNPKSPASVPTKLLYRLGDTILHDLLLGTRLSYDVLSFFQVNLPVFEKALEDIKDKIGTSANIVDMYAGVGTIGLCVNAQKLIELDDSNISMARANAGKHVEVIAASTEQSLEHISSDATIVFDPPRAGLHAKVIDRISEVLPEKIVYLSCNPATQARDVAKLRDKYDISFARGYNFFPRTPHIESLVILVKR